MRFVRSMRDLGAVEVAIGDAKVTFRDVIRADAVRYEKIEDPQQAKADLETFLYGSSDTPTYEELGALEDVQEDPSSNWFTQRVPSRYGNES